MWTFLRENYSDGSEGHSYGLLLISSFIMTMCPFMHHILCSFLAKYQITKVTQPPPHNPNLAPCNFWLFPKLKSPLKGMRFWTLDEIQENTTGQLMVIGRTVWGPKVLTLKGTEIPLPYVQCFLYLVASSINISSFHSTWLDTFWTDLFYTKIQLENVLNKQFYWIFYSFSISFFGLTFFTIHSFIIDF